MIFAMWKFLSPGQNVPKPMFTNGSSLSLWHFPDIRGKLPLFIESSGMMQQLPSSWDSLWNFYHQWIQKLKTSSSTSCLSSHRMFEFPPHPLCASNSSDLFVAGFTAVISMTTSTIIDPLIQLASHDHWQTPYCLHMQQGENQQAFAVMNGKDLLDDENFNSTTPHSKKNMSCLKPLDGIWHSQKHHVSSLPDCLKWPEQHFRYHPK